MKIIELFAGIGGFSEAGKALGWETIAWCEINPFGQKILKHHHPHAKEHYDIRATDFTIYRGKCDIITGGFPCQPYSVAGQRKGTEDERHLWPEMLRAIREVAPDWVVGENVRGLVNWNGGVVFNQVQADLESQGYEVFPFLLPACGVGAPHRRDRIWFVAFNSNNKGSGSGFRPVQEENGEVSKRHTNAKSCDTDSEHAANANNKGIQRREASGRFGEVGSNPQQFARRLHQQLDWQNFPTQPPVCNGDDGFSTDALRQRIRADSLGYLSEKEIDKIISKAATEWRIETIKAGGNAIVHQVALQIFKVIDQFICNNH